MERLIEKDPCINLVYAVNELAVAVAYEALRALRSCRCIYLWDFTIDVGNVVSYRIEFQFAT